MTSETATAQRYHLALHLAHRWFAFLEAPGGDLDTHLTMFNPQVRLSGRRGGHQFANDHASLVAWFAAIPDEISSHHIVHSSYATAENGDGLLSMVVTYQANGDTGVHGSIISYETRIEFTSDLPRFIALDKTPILANTRSTYETSWAINRVAALVHAELGNGHRNRESALRTALGNDVGQVYVHASAAEGSGRYEALVTATGAVHRQPKIVRLEISDDVSSPLPSILTMKMVTSLYSA